MACFLARASTKSSPATLAHYKHHLCLREGCQLIRSHQLGVACTTQCAAAAHLIGELPTTGPLSWIHIDSLHCPCCKITTLVPLTRLNSPSSAQNPQDAMRSPPASGRCARSSRTAQRRLGMAPPNHRLYLGQLPNTSTFTDIPYLAETSKQKAPGRATAPPLCLWSDSPKAGAAPA